ncbi:DMT family transporter [Bacillus sp. FJAT-28004]|uniref:DMT family transporter n=1 Tax=Bacillus sp. FJAT-28004 TaxID=1679165 RepID=UPI0007C871FE|nr:DMT family transporter [Bacillus sp. FJAT-28004]
MNVDQLLFLSLLLVIGSGLLNAICGYLTKKSMNKGVFLGSMIVVASVLLTPHLLMELVRSDLPAKAYALLALSMMIQVMNGYLLSKAYMLGDLSQVYPIMRGTGVILIPIIGVLFLGETLSLWGWAGVAGIACGIFMLSGWNPRARDHLTLRPVLAAFQVGLCITCYTIVDKMALAYISPLSLLQIGNFGFLLVFLRPLCKWGLVRQEWSVNWKFILIAALFSPASYLLFLIAMDMAPVSRLAPIREIGTVFATLLGVWLLKEKQGWRRLVTSVMIATGIVIIGLSG